MLIVLGPHVNLAAKAESDILSKQAEIVWSQFDGQNREIYYSWLTDSGWSDGLKLSDSSETNMMPCVCSGNDGLSWAVWTTDRGLESDLFYAYSNAGKWVEPIKISTGLRNNVAPSMVLDQENRPWIAWSGSKADGKGSDIFCSWWNGSAWEEPLRVNKPDATPDIMPLMGIEGNVPWVCWFGFDGSRYRVYCSRWSSKGWSEEIQSENGALYDLLMKMGEQRMIPPLPGGITDPEKACVYVRNEGALKSIPMRYFTLKDLLGMAAQNSTETIRSGESASGDLVILSFGDSITQGYPDITTVGGGRRVGGYEPTLETLLVDDSRPSQVLNWGVGGERTFTGVGRIDSVLSDPTADYILILEGTNDYDEISWEDTIINLGLMVDKSVAQNIVPILSTLTPDTVIDQFDKDIIIKTSYNPGIKDLAVQKAVILADQYDGLIANWKSQPLTGDGLHPNTEGYEAMAHIWFGVIPGPPLATTTAAGPIGFTTAVLNGTVNPNGSGTQYYFEYGQTTTYGNSTVSTSAGSGEGVAMVNASVIGLTGEILYHFRIVATNNAGIAYGEDLTFMTHIPPCDGCEEDIVILKNVIFPSGTFCECVAGISIAVENVTIESGANVSFKAPEINISKQFNAESGSSVSIKQN